MGVVLWPLGLFVIGVAVGTFGTVVGAGGGFLLVPLLALLEPTLRPEAITAVSLAVVAMNATSGAIAYGRQRRIDYRAGIPFALATLPGSVAGVLLVRSISRDLFDLVFAVVLIGLAVFLLASHEERAGGPYDVNVPLGAALSAVVGLVSSFLGIGGGVIHVPALVGLLRMPTHIATATSHFVLAIMATVGTITHVASGDLAGLEAQTIVLGIGAVIGAQIGARLSTRVGGVAIVRVLAVSLGFVGVRLAAGALLHL